MKLSLKEDALARRLAAFSRFQPPPAPWPGRGCSGPRLLTRTSGGRGERATSAPARKSPSPGHPDTGRGPLRPGVQSVGGARSARRVQGHSAKTWLRGALSAAWHGHRSPHGGRSWWRAEPAGAGCPLPVSGSCGCVLWLSTQPGRDLASGADVPPRTGHTCSPRLARPPAVPGLSWLEWRSGAPRSLTHVGPILPLRRISLSVQPQTSHDRQSLSTPASGLARRLGLGPSPYFVFFLSNLVCRVKMRTLGKRYNNYLGDTNSSCADCIIKGSGTRGQFCE